MDTEVYDLLIIGGGINGAGIAADAAGRGLKVLLAEKGDLASGTSSQSSKLIHGGLRYLEHWEFRLVRKALQEREVLLAKAPHIIRPLRFVLPVVAGMRRSPMLRAGLWLYDHLSARKSLPASSPLDLRADPAGRALKAELSRGFAYWDCWVDDARLVVLNAQDAARRGASIQTRTKAVSARADGAHWIVTLEDGTRRADVRARAVVNAAGPWAGSVSQIAPAGQGSGPLKLRLVKGSHIVVPRLRGAEDAYLLQAPDGRVVFALPFEERFTLIGTTDEPFSGDAGEAAISAAETVYLLKVAGEYFKSRLTAGDIVWSFSGVRPLVEDGAQNPSAASRDYRLELEAGPGQPAWLSVVGGKVTTYRRLAEAALETLAPHLPAMGARWTATRALPGGDVGAGGAEAYLLDLGRRYPRFEPVVLSRLFRRYGSQTPMLLGDARTLADLGEDLGGGVSVREVAYLKQNEWAREPEDILWRRTKAGVHLKPAERRLAMARIAKHL